MTRRDRHGFSLLEVLLATSILIGSTIVLLELVSIGNRHASSARDLSKSQLICQTKLNEILIGAAPVEAVRPTPIPEDPQWIYWVELQSPDQAGFVAVEVGAAYEPAPQKQSARFKLVRWMRDPRMSTNPSEQPATPPADSAKLASPSEASAMNEYLRTNVAPRSSRRGFTLIEVLLTTVLAAVLLAALWSLLSMYSKMFETGQAKTEQSQLCRTLLRQMSDDLHGVVLTPPLVPPVPVIVAALPSMPDGSSAAAPTSNTSAPASGAPANGATAASAPSTASSPNVTATYSPSAKPQTPTGGSTSASIGQAAPPVGAAQLGGNQAVAVTSSLRPSGLFGTESYLQIDIFQATDVSSDDESREPKVFGVPVPSKAPELRTIIYAFDESRDPNHRLGETRMCLTRRELDWEQAHPASKNATAGRGSAFRRRMMNGPETVQESSPSETASARIPVEKETVVLNDDTSATVPEVAQFALRYFDGKMWSKEWDSAARQGLPVAVEVSLQLHTADDLAALSTTAPIHNPPSDVDVTKPPRLPSHRLVVQMPSAAVPKQVDRGMLGEAKSPARNPHSGPTRMPASARTDVETAGTVPILRSPRSKMGLSPSPSSFEIGSNHTRGPRTTSLRTPPRERSAMVLVLVLIVVAMIALAGFGFAELMLTENKATHLHGDELTLDQAIGSGTEFLKSICEQPQQQQNLAGGVFSNPTLFQGVPLVRDDRRNRGPTHLVRFSIIAPKIKDPKSTESATSDEIRYGVQNESGRLHLADLLRWDQQQPGSGRMALLHLPGMTEAVADAILDWIDPDSNPRELGAEADFYAGLPGPYGPRNGLPECLEELLLVKGVTREVLFGLDPNYNRHRDEDDRFRSSRTSRAAEQATPVAPWASLLTLYSGYRNVTSAGQPRIDLNGTDLAQLQSQLTAALDPNWAAFIIAYRQYGPFGGSDAGMQAPPPVDTSVPLRFSISSILDLAGARVSIRGATPQQPAKIYSSPMGDDPQTLGQHLPNLLEKTTVVPLPVVRGGVSVNHAPPSVLCCVPGIDEALANRIVMARTAQAPAEDSSRRFATWILSEGLVDLNTMKKLMPNLSGGGDVVRAQVVAYFDDREPAASAEVVIDAMTIPARQVFWRDQRFWGTGYRLEQLNGRDSGAPRVR